jgi:hypothetical protein
VTLPRARRLEDVLVAAVVAHTVAVGLVLLVVPGWGLRLGGWTAPPPLFFPRQAGAFHLAVAFGYALEYARRRSVTLLVVTKAIATVFLSSAAASGEGAWLIPASAAGDAAMGAAVLLAHRGARRPAVAT